MSINAKRIALAIIHGYKKDIWPGKNPDSIIGWMKDGVYVSVIPDYANDLNALYQIEKIIYKDEVLWKQYRYWLEAACQNDDILIAAPQQRFTALITVLNIQEADAPEQHKAQTN